MWNFYNFWRENSNSDRNQCIIITIVFSLLIFGMKIKIQNFVNVLKNFIWLPSRNHDYFMLLYIQRLIKKKRNQSIFLLLHCFLESFLLQHYALQISYDSGSAIDTWLFLAISKFPTSFHWQLEIWSSGQTNWRTSFLGLDLYNPPMA